MKLTSDSSTNMDSSTLEEIQGEIVLIESMYGGEVEDLRPCDMTPEERQYLTTAVRLHLTPLDKCSPQRPDHHIMVKIKLETDNEYPNSPARYEIEDFRGITVAEKDEIEALVKSKITEAANKGMVVFYDICRKVKRYLSDHSRPHLSSEHDERLAREQALKLRRQEQEEQQRLLQCEKKKLRSQKMEAANQQYLDERRAERLNMADAHCRSESLQRSVSQPAPHDTPSRKRSSRSTSDNSVGMKAVNVALTNSRGEEVIVEVLRTLSENVEQKSYHTVYEVQRVGCHTMGVLHTWEVRIGHTQARRNSKPSKSAPWEAVRMDEFLHQLNRIEAELPKLLQLSHMHIMEYEAYSIVRSRIDIKVHLLQPNLELRPISHFIDIKESLREYHVREYAEECLKGLCYLHENGVAHGDLRDSCIFAGEGIDSIKIADFCIERILLDAVMNFLNKEAPVTYRSSGLDAMKRDIFRLGVIIISLVRGKRVSQSSPDIPRRLSSKFRDFLKRCIEPDCSLRWTARKLLTHAIFSVSDTSMSTIPAAVGERAVPKDKARKESESNENSDKNSKNLLDEPPPGDSRFVKDYETLGLIGEGGFGRVHKVRNIVDNNVYALKQVLLKQRGREGGEMQRILREVQCLSSLSHDHVVRYYTSWIEDVTLANGIPNSDDEETSSEMESKTEKTPHSREILPKIRFDDEDYDDDDDDEDDDESVTCSDEGVDSDESNSIIFVDTSEGEAMISQRSASCTGRRKKPEQAKIPLPKRLYLFIQMEYCENNTLKHAIDDNLYTKDSRLWRMFRGIISGLDYMHAKNVIHRDLKPGNIFIDGADRVKIGDFGLATVIKNQSSGEKNADDGALQGQLMSVSGEQSGNVGTFFYIAPEFSSLSSSKVQYSSKFDLYSLGIIFFEMTYVLPKSGSERHELMQKVRLPTISLPPEFEEVRYQSKKQILLKLLNHDPEKRPSTYELLNSELLPPLSIEEQMFREKLQKCLQNGDYDVHDDILQALFKPKENLSMEMDFFHLNSGSICKRTPHQVDFVIQILESIFRSYGGIWIPAPLYIPPDGVYAESKTGQKVFKVMSERGSVMTCAPELRYPFARLAVVQGWKKLRRYSIDRFYLPSRILNSDFPVGKFDCAFDYLGAIWEKEELFVRILKLGQDIIKVLTDTTRHVSSSDVVLEVDHLPLAVAILSSCGVDKQLHMEALGTITDGLQCRLSLPELCSALHGVGVAEKSCRSLKPFLLMDGTFEDILEKIIVKCTSNSQKEVLAQAKIFRRTLQKATDLGVDLTTRVQPLRFSNSSLYNDFMCRFVMSNLRSGKNSKKSYVVAKGGMFDELVSRCKENLPPSQVCSDPVAAVGMSFSLECLVAAVFSDGDPKTATSSLPDLPSTSTLGCGRGDMTVCVAYVGHGMENNARMAERVLIFTELRKNNLVCDLAHFKCENDLADFYCPYLVVISDASDKATIKYNSARPGVWFSQKVVSISDVSTELLRLILGKNYSAVQTSRDSANVTM